MLVDSLQSTRNSPPRGSKQNEKILWMVAKSCTTVQKPWNDDSSTMISKRCRILSIHCIKGKRIEFLVDSLQRTARDKHKKKVLTKRVYSIWGSPTLIHLGQLQVDAKGLLPKA